MADMSATEEAQHEADIDRFLNANVKSYIMRRLRQVPILRERINELAAERDQLKRKLVDQGDQFRPVVGFDEIGVGDLIAITWNNPQGESFCVAGWVESIVPGERIDFDGGTSWVDRGSEMSHVTFVRLRRRLIVDRSISTSRITVGNLSIEDRTNKGRSYDF